MDKGEDRRGPYTSKAAKDFAREIRLGLSVYDLEYIDERLDFSSRNNFIKELQAVKEIERIQNSIDMAEAVRMANISVINNKKFKGFLAYKRWYNKLIRRANKLMGKKNRTIWERIKPNKSSKIGG